MLLYMHSVLASVARRHLTSSCSLLLSASTSLRASSSHKAKLAELRKLTGFSFSLCKSALSEHEYDVERAAQWLNSQAQAEGWARVQKLSDRVARQGLVCVAHQHGSAALIEVRCETDFVARTELFVSLAQQLATSCLPSAQQLSDAIAGVELAGLRTAGGVPLPDLVAEAVGKLGEKIELGRALVASSSPGVHLSTYVHPSREAVTLQTGRYGAMVLFRRREEGASQRRALPPHKLGRNLCQHVVGMAPLSLGDPLFVPEEEPVVEDEEKEDSEKLDQEESAEEGEEEPEKTIPTTLLDQECLVDPDMTVREYLTRHNVEILEFARIECGV